MTQQLTAPRPVAARPAPRKPGPGSYLWLVWRQHGGLIVTLGVATLVLCTALVIDARALADVHCVPVVNNVLGPLPPASCGSNGFVDGDLFPVSVWLLRATMFAPVVFGVFWGAPLVARERESRTTDLAWGQGISARRWLVGKLAVLSGLAALMSVALWVCARPAAAGMGRVAGFEVGGRFGPLLFATSAPLVVPYVLASLAVGVLASVALKKTLPAMALAGAVCLGLGVGNADLLRPHYMVAKVVQGAIGDDTFTVAGDPLVVSAGWADVHGDPVKGYPRACDADSPTCLHAHGIFSRYIEYQPGSREAEFQWLEAALALVVAGLAGSLALWRVRPAASRRVSFEPQRVPRPTPIRSAARRPALPKPGLRSYLWLGWRQHGGLLVWSVVAVATLCAALLFAQSDLASTHCASPWIPWLAAGNCQGVAIDHVTLYTWSCRLLECVVFAPVLLGAVWGAPLVAREYERGTQDVAWGQAISARRWLVGKLTALAVLAVVLTFPLWLCARLVAASMVRVAPWQVGEAFGWAPFATLSPLVVPYSVVALAVGVLASVLLRRTIPAIVVTALVCVGLGVGTADLARPHYLPATTAYAPINVHGGGGPADAHDALYLQDFAWADAAGHEVMPRSLICLDTESQVDCLSRVGISQTMSRYQPSTREAEFQWIEGALALALAAGLGSLAVWRLRRR